jgi:hypothetical protein
MRAIAIMSLLVIGAVAESTAQDARKTVRVYVVTNTTEGNLNVSWAQSIASHIFAEAGVRIKWQFGEPRHREQDVPIIITVSSNTPETLAPRALAYAHVFEGVHISVFCDRIRNTVHGSDRLGTFLLAHVMAHEIVHILEGIDRHSEAGLMKASWTKKEIEEMSVQPLSLAPEDVRLIHIGLLKQETTGLRAGQSGLAHP